MLQGMERWMFRVLMYRIEGTLDTHLSYDSTFYSPTIRYHIASHPSLQKVPNHTVSISYPISTCQSTKITTNNCAINRIRNNTALDSSGHAPLKINVLNFYSLSPLFRTSTLVKLKFFVCNRLDFRRCIVSCPSLDTLWLGS